VAATRYCPNCGLERREGERFCRNCEAPVQAAAAAPATPTAPPPAAAGSAPADPPPGVPVSTGLPAPPSAPHPVPQRSRPTELPFKPLALAGGSAMILSVLLPWISIGGSTTNALDVPIQALWDLNTTDGAVKLGFVVMALGAVGAGLSFVAKTAKIRRLAGSIGLAVVLAFALQLYRSVDQSGGSFGDALGAIGIGVYVALAGAVALQISK
jgi:hypothetical protein